MYAVVHSGGKQYKVQKGEILRVEKLPGEIGSKVSFDKVLMFSDGENVRIGQPVLDDVTVEGNIVEQGKYKKIIVFKYKKRKRYRKKQGHRQQYTAIRIESIGGQGDSEQRLSDKEEIKASAETAELEQKTQAPSEEHSTDAMETDAVEQKQQISDTEETE